MMELCECMFDGNGMWDEWQTIALVPLFKEKGNAINCNAYEGVKLLVDAMKIAERVLERQISEC